MSAQIMHIHGHVGSDPEIKEYSSRDGGKFKVARFSLAVDHKFDDKTDWFNCEVMGKQVEFIEKHISKGQELSLYGRHESRTYTDKGGNNRIGWSFKIDHVDFCGKKSDNPQRSNAGVPSTIQTVASSPDPEPSNEDKLRAAISPDSFPPLAEEDMPY